MNAPLLLPFLEMTCMLFCPCHTLSLYRLSKSIESIICHQSCVTLDEFSFSVNYVDFVRDALLFFSLAVVAMMLTTLFLFILTKPEIFNTSFPVQHRISSRNN